MKDSKADLILHPVRLRIIQVLAGKQRLTAQQISEALPDVPQASLYRHIKKLVDGGFLSVVDQTPIRGTVEKTYALVENNEHMSLEEFRSLSKEEHMDYFLRFIAIVLGDFERYVSQEGFDFVRDGAGYRQATLFLTDEEFQEFTQKMGMIMMEAVQKEPSKERRARTLTTIMTSEVKNG
jgi:DNA-binding transcriptional ArsR family regulator